MTFLKPAPAGANYGARFSVRRLGISNPRHLKLAKRFLVELALSKKVNPRGKFIGVSCNNGRDETLLGIACFSKHPKRPLPEITFLAANPHREFLQATGKTVGEELVAHILSQSNSTSALVLTSISPAARKRIGKFQGAKLSEVPAKKGLALKLLFPKSYILQFENPPQPRLKISTLS